MNIKLSRHAEEKMVERGISIKEIQTAISAGSKFVQQPDKIVSEFGYFSVVYKKVGDTIYIITVKPRW